MTTDYLLVQTPEGLQLQSLKFPKFKPILVDFSSARLLYRRSQGATIYSEHLVRACGVKPQHSTFVIDATAGLGQDAGLLFAVGCRVLMIERSAILAALLHDGLLRLQQASPQMEVQGLQLYQGDAIAFLSALAVDEAAERPDVVYLDPMFEPRNKAALVKKEMRMIRDIVGEDLDADALLQVALKCAKKRVVVKRHRHADPLMQKEPSYSIEGKVGRFDIYIITK